MSSHRTRDKKSVLNGTLTAVISEICDTSSPGIQGDTLIITNKYYEKGFHTPNGTISKASKLAKIEHRLQEPDQQIDMVPDLVYHTLLSASKFENADYISIYDGREVNIHYGQNTKIVIPETEVLKGWRFPVTRLWQITLKANITNLNKETLSLNSKDR